MKHTNESKSKTHKDPSTNPQNNTEMQETPQTEQDTQEAQTPCSEEDQTPCREVETAEQALEALQGKYDQLNDSYLRLMAEYDNYRKRTLKEKAELIKSGGESVLISILSVVDDMERGIKASEEATDIDAVKEGMALIHSKFLAFLKQHGINTIEAEGQPFDTDHHEAIATVPAPEEGLKGKVLDCVQKGYFLHDKVIRFAKVIVGE